MSSQKDQSIKLYHAEEVTGSIGDGFTTEIVASSEYDALTGMMEFLLPDGSSLAIAMDCAPACDMTVYWTRPDRAE